MDDDKTSKEIRAEIRKMNLELEKNKQMGEAHDSLMSRSVVLSTLKKGWGNENFSGFDFFLAILGLLSVIIVVIDGCCWVPTTIAFFAYSLGFPIYEYITHYHIVDGNIFLSKALTLVFVCCIAILLILLHWVWRFQLVRADIVDIKGFPSRFYCDEVLTEIEKRYGVAAKKKEIRDFLNVTFSADVANIIAEYTDNLRVMAYFQNRSSTLRRLSSQTLTLVRQGSSK